MPNITYQEILEEQVFKTPYNIAVVCNSEQLNAKANKLAALLRAKGVKRDSVVGLLIGHSADIIVAQIAIMKAGGAFLLIDPEYPQSRIDFMLEESKAVLLLTHSAFMLKVKKFSGEVLDLNDGKIYPDTVEPLPLINKAEDLAYVIYTSGSTGKPKGVIAAEFGKFMFVRNSRQLSYRYFEANDIRYTFLPTKLGEQFINILIISLCGLWWWAEKS